MKKVILFAAILFSSISVMNVQAQAPKSGTATLSLKLDAVQSILVTGDVLIHYSDAEDYDKGKAGQSATTVTVTSAGGFAVRAEADDLKDGNYTIGASTISVSAAALENSGDASYETNTLEKIGAGKEALITSGTGGVNKKYSVTYEGTGGNAYMEKYNEGGRNYETTVIFTVSAS